MHRHALSSMSAKVVSAPMAAASSRWTMMSGYLQRAVCKVHSGQARTGGWAM